MFLVLNEKLLIFLSYNGRGVPTKFFINMNINVMVNFFV